MHNRFHSTLIQWVNWRVGESQRFGKAGDSCCNFSSMDIKKYGERKQANDFAKEKIQADHQIKPAKLDQIIAVKFREPLENAKAKVDT